MALGELHIEKSDKPGEFYNSILHHRRIEIRDPSYLDIIVPSDLKSEGEKRCPTSCHAAC